MVLLALAKFRLPLGRKRGLESHLGQKGVVGSAHLLQGTFKGLTLNLGMQDAQP